LLLAAQLWQLAHPYCPNRHADALWYLVLGGNSSIP
jgi:hypothetical protein